MPGPIGSAEKTHDSTAATTHAPEPQKTQAPARRTSTDTSNAEYSKKFKPDTQSGTWQGKDFSLQPIPHITITTVAAAGDTGTTGHTDDVSGTAASRGDAMADTGQSPRTPHPVCTNVESSVAGVREVLAAFKEETANTPVAVVSGGSISGYATALKLKNLGYNVIVAEQRTHYSRQNVFTLKEDSIYSLAHLSPDGSLLQDMLDDKLITVAKNKIISHEGGGLKLVPEPTQRFMDWLVATSRLDLKIPKSSAAEKDKMPHHNLANSSDTGHQPKPHHLDYIDPAWPAGQPVEAVSPQDWRHEDLSAMSTDSFILAQVMDLENGLNRHCAKNGIKIVRAAIRLEGEEDGEQSFVPHFLVGDPAHPESVAPDFDIDLICIAEGANSRNRGKISKDLDPVNTNERWSQGNYVCKPNTLMGFHTVDVAPEDITVTQYIEQPEQSLVNVSVYSKADSVLDKKEVDEKLGSAQEHVILGNSPLTISEETRQYESGGIDIVLRRADRQIHKNVVLIGDTAGSGSPAGGYGGSLALSAFPEAIARLVCHPSFLMPPHSAERQRLAAIYHNDVSDILDIRHGRPSEILRRAGFYSPETNNERIQQAAQGRFGSRS